MDETIKAVGVITGIIFIVFMMWICIIMFHMSTEFHTSTETDNFFKTLEYRETESCVGNESVIAKNISMYAGYNISMNLSYVGVFANSTLYEFNETACDESVKNLGLNCTCLICGRWSGYETKGFYNRTGVYYSDGTPTFMTMRQLADYEEMQSNVRYRAFMHEHGISV